MKNLCKRCFGFVFFLLLRSCILLIVCMVEDDFVGIWFIWRLLIIVMWFDICWSIVSIFRLVVMVWGLFNFKWWMFFCGLLMLIIMFGLRMNFCGLRVDVDWYVWVGILFKIKLFDMMLKNCFVVLCVGFIIFKSDMFF